ncbi:MAG: NifB/NifX family molybdenum-iron cluster-binding protein [Candidatus Latescibacteria bacterium]|jgi:predicted Fe-Mo cluster-binding NifX family protein|nr:NifB/NifX family molybdenum-iron cluster-binding protein [Candidatus Latescibacterota bacterium]
MKIAASSQGKELSSMVDPRFGRAQYFIVVDTETGEYTSHSNEMNLNAMQGAGIQSAKNVSDFGVQAVISGNMGPNAFATLQAAGIDVYVKASGTVRDAVDAFKEGKLEKIDKANVGGHWA